MSHSYVFLGDLLDDQYEGVHAVQYTTHKVS